MIYDCEDTIRIRPASGAAGQYEPHQKQIHFWGDKRIRTSWNDAEVNRDGRLERGPGGAAVHERGYHQEKHGQNGVDLSA